MQPIAAISGPLARCLQLHPFMTTKSVTSDKFPLEHQIEEMDYQAVYSQWLSDKSPNKGTEEDYLARKLADGWRVAESGASIWRPIDNLGLATTNQPASAVNPGFIEAAIQSGRDKHIESERKGYMTEPPTAPPSTRPAPEAMANRENPVVEAKPIAGTTRGEARNR